MPETLHQATHDGPSIRITERDDRSALMAVLLRVVRLFRKQLNASPSAHEDGSIKLSPPKNRVKPCTISHRTVCDIHIYDLVPPLPPAKQPTRRIYYLAGGSWQQAPSTQHWWVCAKLALAMPDTVVSVVSPPLAPNNTASSSFPWCMRLYRALLREAATAGERVTLMGDSSGANMVLCMVLEALREDAEDRSTENSSVKPTPHPHSIMVISPSTDLTRSNPAIETLRAVDPLLSPSIIRETARAWVADDVDPAHRTVSPINADISLLAQSGVRVHGVTAGYDVLSPDGVLFREELARCGVRGEWLHWGKQMHCFVLTAPYRLREGREGFEWVVEVLKRD